MSMRPFIVAQGFFIAFVGGFGSSGSGGVGRNVGVVCGMIMVKGPRRELLKPSIYTKGKRVGSHKRGGPLWYPSSFMAHQRTANVLQMSTHQGLSLSYMLLRLHLLLEWHKLYFTVSHGCLGASFASEQLKEFVEIMKSHFWFFCFFIFHFSEVCKSDMFKLVESVNLHVKSENESAIEVSCNDHFAIKSELKMQNVSIIIDEAEFRCGNLIHKVEEMPGVYRITSHNVLESITDLMIYWRRPKAVFIFDSYSGFLPQQASNYLQKRSIKPSLINLENSSEFSSQIFNSTYYKTENFVIVCHPILLQQLLKEIVLQDLLTKNLTWIIVSDSTPKEIIGEDIPPNSQMTYNLITASYICIYDIFYNPSANRTESIKFADWNVSRSNKLIMMEHLDDKDKLRLRERRVRVVVFEHLPYSIFTKVNDTLHVAGYIKEMLGTLLTTYNARYTLREIDAVFGIGTNGTYTGMVGVFYRREADMAFNVLAMTNSRARAVRYAGPVTKAYLAIIYNRPQAIIPPTTYLMPFSIPVWIAAVVLLTLVIFAIMITFSTSPAINNQSQHIHKWSFRAFTFALIEEALDYSPGAAAKIIQGTFLLATLMTFIHYTSTFTAFLAYQEEKIPFTSIEDVVRRKEYTVLLVKNTRHEDMFKYAPPGPYLETWRRVVLQGEKSYSSTFESAYKDLCNSAKAVLLTDGPTNVYLSNGNCSVVFAPVKYLEEYYNTPHRCDFPYTRIFTMGLTKILESGILKRLTLAYSLANRPPCLLENTSTSFGLDQVQAGASFNSKVSTLCGLSVTQLEAYVVVLL
ncbi:Glutamate receptor 2 [Chamberlinius hualienensis]